MVWFRAGRDGETKGNRNEKKQKGNGGEETKGKRGEQRDTALVIFCRKN
jgi:hypothetical protein